MYRYLPKFLKTQIFTHVDPTKLIIVEATPRYVTKEQWESDFSASKPLTANQKKHNDLLTFAKLKKINLNYIFETDGWKYVIKKINVIQNKTIRYEIKFTPLSSSTNQLPLSYLQAWTADGFHKHTTAGDPLPLTTKKDDTFVIIQFRDVKVFQK
jgi:hypothetical protein